VPLNFFMVLPKSFLDMLKTRILRVSSVSVLLMRW